MPMVLKIQKGQQVPVGANDNICALTSVSPVGNTRPLVFIPVETLAAPSPGAGADIDFSPVDKHFLQT